MAEIITPNPPAGVTSTSGDVTVSNGTPSVAAGDGKVINGVLNTATSNEEVPDLLHTPFDRAVTIQGYPDTVFNQMFRKMGYRQIKSMAFDHFSVDQRRNAGFVAESNAVSVTTAAIESGKTKTVSKTIKVADAELFDITDQVVFKGVKGYDNHGKQHVGYYLNGYVVARSLTEGSNSITVLLTNASAAAVSGSQPTISIPATCEIIILGHALAEEDASVAPSTTMPEPSEQYMQKFMTSASVTHVWKESDKNCDWGIAQIKEGVSREFLLETEKTYLFGHKAYFKDTTNGNKYIRTMGGLLEQLLEEGVEPIEVWKDELTDESIIETMKAAFVGNRGSERRYMVTGMDFAAALFSLKSMQRRVNTDVKHEYTYDWDQWKLFNFTILNKPYSLFDMLGYGNWAFLFDKANIERVVFRPMDEDMLDLDKLMIEDSDVMRCCEISSMVLKYAKCHRLIIMHDGDKTSNANGANDVARFAA